MNFVTNLLFLILSISAFAIDEEPKLETGNNLNCDFDEDFCGWKNIALPPENKKRWKLVEKQLVLQNQQYYSYLNSGFIFTEFDGNPSVTTLISNVIDVNDAITIHFQAQILGSARLSICQKLVNSMNTRFQNCQFYSSDHNFGFKQYFYELSLFSRGKSQIVIRAFCPNFGDNIGVDSIEVMNETVLRPKRHDGQQNIQVITFDEWIRSKNDTSQIPTVNMRPKVLLVVSKSVENTTETPENEKHFEKDQKNCTKSFCLEDASKENEQNATENLQSKDDSVTKMPTLAENSKTSVEDPKQALANLAQWMSILRNLAPILPVIPSLINSLKNGDSPPTSSAAANFHGNNAYTDPTMPVAEPIFSFKNMAVQRRFPQVPAITPVNQRNPNESLQSFSATSFPSANFKAPMKKDAELLHDLNLSTLTVNELKTLESIHKKIFPIKSENQQKTTMEVGESRRKPLKTQENLVKLRKNSAVAVSTTTNAPIVIFDKPKQVTKSSPVETDSNDSKQFRYLTPEMLRELNMVANMPDLEPLTEGLDLSLLNKPGGFSILKQQFLERLFQKIPLKSEDSDLLLSS